MDPCTPLLARLYGEAACWSRPVALVADGTEVATNPANVRFPHLPALLAGGVEIAHADGRGLWRFALPRPVAVPAGGEVVVPAGALRVPLAEVYALGLVLQAPAATGPEPSVPEATVRDCDPGLACSQ